MFFMIQKYRCFALSITFFTVFLKTAGKKRGFRVKIADLGSSRGEHLIDLNTPSTCSRPAGLPRVSPGLSKFNTGALGEYYSSRRQLSLRSGANKDGEAAVFTFPNIIIKL